MNALLRLLAVGLALCAALRVQAQNTPPTISAIANVSIVRSGTTDPLSFTVGDAQTAAGDLLLSASSSNPSLLPVGNITFGGQNAQRTVCASPLPNLTGSTSLTVTVADPGGLSATRTFMVTVHAPAPPPLVPSPVVTRLLDGSARLDWNAENGGWYAVEHSADLQQWRPLGPAVRAAGTTASWTDDGSATGSAPGVVAHRFYRLRALGVFTVTFNGRNFTYVDADRTVTGVHYQPTGSGTFPACLISHGQGGSAVGYSGGKATEFLAWGLGSIAPNYAHQANGDASPVLSGFSPENLARGLAARNILATLAWVDQSRVALWGHSKGAWLSIGLGGVIGDRILAAGVSAGGIMPDSSGVDQAAPTETQAAGVRTPWIMFHGEGDTVVLPAGSALFEQELSERGVPNFRQLYPTNQHNLHQDPVINADMIGQYRTWLQQHGVLPP